MLESYEYLSGTRDDFTIGKIRDLFEAFLDRLKVLNVIDKELNSTMNCAFFLSYYSTETRLNGHRDYIYFDNIFPLGIAGYVLSFQDLLQKGCHQEFYRSLEDTISLKLMTVGLINQLYFFLNWFGANFKDYQDPDVNRSRWEKK